ncbi:MAG: hypothetical protein RBS05_19120 [Zoogloea oleivorans]|uniref:hypothetical protein n=1 Tax=Zoogloea oleivorans TaxID=1552750 RepID=UPI002A3697C1|nr:hypothetical protein [Zoogloea oleivorans]MDY0038029.1 hypothetical protein [Zoogloea oleivorans]
MLIIDYQLNYLLETISLAFIVNKLAKISRVAAGGILATLVIAAICDLGFIVTLNAAEFTNGQKVIAKINQTQAIGDLGGAPVSIPKPYARFLEYDGDPHWLESKSTTTIKRTFQSKISGFGFEIRFPEMEVLTENNTRDKQSQNIYTTNWMRVGVNSNSSYGAGGDESLDRYLASIPKADEHRIRYSFEPLAQKTFGLNGLTPIGIDESRRVLGKGGADMRDKNVYFHRDKDGLVDTFIECSNMEHLAAECRQFFNLRPAMRTRVSVSYRKELLSHWRDIQSAVSQVILGFRVDPRSFNKSTE